MRLSKYKAFFNLCHLACVCSRCFGSVLISIRFFLYSLQSPFHVFFLYIFFSRLGKCCACMTRYCRLCKNAISPLIPFQIRLKCFGLFLQRSRRMFRIFPHRFLGFFGLLFNVPHNSNVANFSTVNKPPEIRRFFRPI